MNNFSIHLPHPVLQPYVKLYSILRLDADTHLDTIFTPSMNTGLLFHFGGNHSAISNSFINSQEKGKYTFNQNELWLCGMHTEPIHSTTSTTVCALNAICTPLGIYHLLKDSPKVILNGGGTFIDVNIHKNFDGLIGKLQESKTDKEALQLVDSHLLTYFSRLKIPFSVKDMTPVSEYITKHNGMVKIKQLGEKFRVSCRWLEKQFDEQIGLSPKEFARITRFQALLAQANVLPTLSIGALIETFGYTDYSHLRKDFNAYTGQTPKQFFKDKQPSLNSVYYTDL